VTAPALDLRFPADHGLADLISAELQDLSPTAVHEIDPDGPFLWRLFFASVQARDEGSRALVRRFGADGLTAEAADVPDEDWAARSQADLRHVRIGRIVVAPPWDAPSPRATAELLVVIRPSMGFGTGHHATTRLCLRLLQRIECAGRRVLDVGTGSGVLAIAAARLGASDVLGIDIDADALASASENLALNGATLPVRFERTDLRDFRRSADIVLANLTGAALVTCATQLLSCTSPGGRLVLSGFQPHEADAVAGAFGDASCEAKESDEDWVAAALVRHARPPEGGPRQGGPYKAPQA